MKTPYLDWIISHLHIYEYRLNYSYSRGELVTIDDSIYQSLSDNNLQNYPINSNHWNKIL